MLKKIILYNFQPHKKSILEIASDVTAILGPNDSGKTSIKRGIEWVTTNRPLGNSFIRREEKEASVQLDFDDVSVIRERSDKVNSYRLGTDGKNIFKAMKGGIPEEVAGAINLSELNIQSSRDAPFLFSEGSSGAAKLLNHAINLEVIDKSISYVNVLKRRTNQSLRLYQEQYESHKTKLEKFAFLSEAEEKLEKLESASKSIINNQNKYWKIEKLLKDIREIQYEMATFENLDDKLSKLDELHKTNQNLENLRSIGGKLAFLIDEISGVKRDIKTLEMDSKQATKEYDKFLASLGKCPYCGHSINDKGE